MNHRANRTTCFLLAALLTPVSVVLAQTPMPAPSPGDAALAEKFCEMAQGSLQAKQLTNAVWSESSALLQEAARLNPTEPRYAKLLTELMLSMKDVKGAMDALAAYRKLRPHDQVPQVQAIDLYTGQLETADAKIKYLKDISNKTPVAAEVRAHAAVRCADLLLERSQLDEADQMITLALKLNPVSVEALNRRYRFSFRSMPAPEKMGLLLAMVRANPSQFAAISAVADLLSDVGLVDQSLAWYIAGVNLARRANANLPPDFILAYAQELFIADQMKPADDIVSSLLKSQPDNIDAWYLKVLVAKAMGDAGSLERAQVAARNTLANRFAIARKEAGDASATTRPTDAPTDIDVGDPVADAKRIQEANKPQLHDQYVAAALDLAWYRIYFDQQPDAAAKLLEAIKILQPPNDLTLTRLQGWSFLLSGKTDEARVKLSAVAARDPLAALGMLRLEDSSSTTKATTQTSGSPAARHLMAENPSGPLGVILWSEMRQRGVPLVTGALTDAVKGELDRFPMPWLRIIDQPTEFYVIRADAAQVSHSFGEPMFGRITIQNISEMPITIGQDGILHPTLHIDATLRGVAQQNFPGVAIDRMTEALVLQPHEGITETVRIDQGALAQFLSSVPGISIQIYAQVMTNPIYIDRGVYMGPAGYRVQFSKLLERTAVALNSEESKQKIYAALASASPADRMRATELVATYVLVIRSQKPVAGNEEAAQRQKVLAQELSDRVNKSREDPDTSARAWANYLMSVLATDQDRLGVIESMAMGDSWQSRALAVMAAKRLPADGLTKIASTLANRDADPLVRKQAGAAVARASEATTQPNAGAATQPAIESAGMPGPTTAPAGGDSAPKPSSAPAGSE